MCQNDSWPAGKFFFSAAVSCFHHCSCGSSWYYDFSNASVSTIILLRFHFAPFFLLQWIWSLGSLGSLLNLQAADGSILELLSMHANTQRWKYWGRREKCIRKRWSTEKVNARQVLDTTQLEILVDTSEMHKDRQSMVFEAMHLWKIRSGA